MCRFRSFRLFTAVTVLTPGVSKMSGSNGKKITSGSSGMMEWIGTACRFATDRNDFRRSVHVDHMT